MEEARKLDLRPLLVVAGVVAVALTLWASGAFAAGGASLNQPGSSGSFSRGKQWQGKRGGKAGGDGLGVLAVHLDLDREARPGLAFELTRRRPAARRSAFGRRPLGRGPLGRGRLGRCPPLGGRGLGRPAARSLVVPAAGGRRKDEGRGKKQGDDRSAGHVAP